MTHGFKVGRFTVERREVPGSLATRFNVFLRGRLVGTQFSYPSVENCEGMLVPPMTADQVVLRCFAQNRPGRPKKNAPKRETTTYEADDDVE